MNHSVRMMKCAVIILVLICMPAIVIAADPIFVITKPTVIAFFPPVTNERLADGCESLSDFAFYAKSAETPLKKAGIDFHVVYATSFSIRQDKSTTTFRPTEATGGYYFIAPNKKPFVE